MSEETKTKEVLVVASKVKDVLKGAGLRTSGDLVDGLSEKVHALLHSAAERAKADKRQTVRREDLDA